MAAMPLDEEINSNCRKPGQTQVKKGRGIGGYLVLGFFSPPCTGGSKPIAIQGKARLVRELADVHVPMRITLGASQGAIRRLNLAPSVIETVAQKEGETQVSFRRVLGWEKRKKNALS